MVHQLGWSPSIEAFTDRTAPIELVHISALPVLDSQTAKQLQVMTCSQDNSRVQACGHQTNPAISSHVCQVCAGEQMGVASEARQVCLKADLLKHRVGGREARGRIGRRLDSVVGWRFAAGCSVICAACSTAQYTSVQYAGGQQPCFCSKLP